jgi:hypothetical protein
MKIAKSFVLTLILAMTGYVYASGAGQAKTSGDKAACKLGSCCKAKQDCCAPGADCCTEAADCCKVGTECCDPKKASCGPDRQCGKGDDVCCAGGTEKGQCCGSLAARSQANSKGCCGGGCDIKPLLQNSCSPVLTRGQVHP